MSTEHTSQSSENPFKLVVTADDFGIGRKTSEGIIQAHLRGPVTATSLMTITGDHVRSSIPLLAEAPNLDVGLHVVLTSCGEKPVIARESSGIVGRDGFFLSNGQLWMKALTGWIDRRAVADEIAAQAELFVKLVGRQPDYVDSHHHSHQLPIIREALLDVIGHDLLPRITRTTIEAKSTFNGVNGARLRRRAARWMGKQAGKTFATRWLWTNDYFFGMLSGSDQNREFPWEKYLKKLPTSGVVEWIVHPGLPDESLEGRDTYRAERAKELESMTNAMGRSRWEAVKPYLSRKSILSQVPTSQNV